MRAQRHLPLERGRALRRPQLRLAAHGGTRLGLRAARGRVLRRLLWVRTLPRSFARAQALTGAVQAFVVPIGYSVTAVRSAHIRVFVVVGAVAVVAVSVPATSHFPRHLEFSVRVQVPVNLSRRSVQQLPAAVVVVHALVLSQCHRTTSLFIHVIQAHGIDLLPVHELTDLGSDADIENNDDHRRQHKNDEGVDGREHFQQCEVSGVRHADVDPVRELHSGRPRRERVGGHGEQRQADEDAARALRRAQPVFVQRVEDDDPALGCERRHRPGGQKRARVGQVHDQLQVNDEKSSTSTAFSSR